MKLKPCPFCGEKGNGHAGGGGLICAPETGGGYRIWCHTCTTLGPFALNRVDVRDRWNRRKRKVWIVDNGWDCGMQNNHPEKRKP